MYNKYTYLFFFFIFLNTVAQNCKLQITGTVKDAATGLPLDAANLYIEENKKGTITDSNGSFTITNICQGEYHLILSHISCTAKEVFITVTNNKELELILKHSVHELEDVLITGKSSIITNESTETINAQKITDNGSQNLATLIESIPGVSSLKNGNTVAKPIVHGNFGNRLTILNNGIAQSGQQWGNDHSPEIDPLVANKIKVIKGVGALEYLGSNLGSVVLVEPSSIDKEPHLHGKASYFFDSNGLGNGVNFQLQQYAKKIGWKVNATAKKSGDKRARDHFLTNTGNQELNLAIQLEKEFSDRWKTDLFISSFNTELGVLAGSQVGNITDLRNAIREEEPLNTNTNFSFNIDAPKQEVNHHLLKLHAKNRLSDSSFIDYTIATQINNREEFDNRRNRRTEIPALSLLQYSFFGETKYQKSFESGLTLKTGLQINYIDNANDPDTGVLPLIPNYSALEWGGFITSRKKWKNNTLELGFRYDNIIQDVRRISVDLPRRIINENNNFSNLNGSVSIKHRFNEHFTAIYNVGYITRNPAINELYSNGLHQGVSTIEIGNLELDTEKAVKTTLEFSGDVNEVFSFKALAYYQNISDYIYLQPKGLQTTIRGAFPRSEYEQTNADIYGFDLSTKWNITNSLFSTGKFSFIKGINKSDGNIGIINLPSNNFAFSLGYQFPKSITIWGKDFENLELGINSKHVLKQNNISVEQEVDLSIRDTNGNVIEELFAPIPSGYTLFGLNMATNVQIGKNRLRITSKIDNLFNVAYRSYLNRLRYFADDTGINASLGLSLKF